MIKERSAFRSSDGKTDISVIRWIPDEEPVAVLQIVHGMIEYIDRYDEFATYLANQGYLVVGHDHLGHGDSVRTSDDWGFFHETDGNKMLISDIKELMDINKTQWPGKDYFLMGHSMGSFLVRQFLFTYPKESLDGAIIMGTAQKSRFLITFGKYLASREGRKNGWKKPNKMVKKILMKENLKNFAPVKTPCDWLTKDEKKVRQYCMEPKSTFDFTNRAYYDMFTGMLTLLDRNNLNRLNRSLPYLFISGEDDPVGGFGSEVDKVYNQYRKMGIKDVTIKLYKEDRHEILNELDRNQVYKYIYKWLETRRNR